MKNTYLDSERSLSISEIARIVGVTRQTIHMKLKAELLQHPEYKIGNKYLIPWSNVKSFIAFNYPAKYNEVGMVEQKLAVKQSDTKKDGVEMFNIPKGKGAITYKDQSNGIRRYYIRKLPIYIDQDGQVVYYKGPSFISMKEAEVMRTQIMRQRDAGIFKREYSLKLKELQSQKTRHPLASRSFYEYCRLYYTEKRGLQEKTRKDYLDLVESKIKLAFETLTIAELTRTSLQNFIDASSASTNKLFMVLRQPLIQLYKEEVLDEDLTLRLVKPKPAEAKNPTEVLTIAERDQFLAYFDHQVSLLEHADCNYSPDKYEFALRIRYLMYLLFYTGMRLNECLALQWDEINIVSDSECWIHVNASMGLADSTIKRKTTKTRASKRVIPIRNPKVISLLQQAKQSATSKWIAVNATGTRPINGDNFTKRYCIAVSQKLGMSKRVTSRTPRHTFISILCAKGVPVPEISKLAGHTSLEMVTRVYAHAIAAREEQLSFVDGL